IPTLDQSGAERQLTLLATGLPRDQYDLHVIALNRGGYYADLLKQADIPVEVLGKRFRFDPLTWLRLRGRLHRLRPDVVQSYLFAANTYVRLPGVTPSATRIIVSERCVDTWKSGWQLSLDRRLAGRMQAMTANSMSVSDFYQSLGVSRPLLHVIPNGLPIPDAEESVRNQRRQRLRKEAGLEPHHRIVGFAGRLAGQKRLEDLIWAFQLLHQAVDHTRLVLIGSGPERDALARFAANMHCRDKVVFLGHREDAQELIGGMDAFALPSEFEGMSNSLMEAMALGLPVVASNIPANSELVTHEETGLTYPLGNSPELTRALRRVLEDSELAGRLGHTARKLMETQHNVALMVQRHQQLYAELTGGRVRAFQTPVNA
ncbi:MAG: glycosyltransferase, partial [Planctomycetaceae bacterium]|nr:glycosyltransferase [Planctomycetaceae bacterium]